MKLLSIDASSRVAGVALMEGGALVCETNLVSDLRHSEKLMPIVDECFTLAGWEPRDIDVVAAVVGPGSFTGVRIGVAAVKGIAEALGKPVVAVNTLEALAASFAGYGGVVAPILDARHAQVYCAVYGSDLAELAAPAAVDITELLESPVILAAPAVLFAGDGVAPNRETIVQKLGTKAVFAPPHLMLQRAGAAACVAWKKAEAGQAMDAAQLMPLYLRKSSAEQVREKREAAHDR